MTRKNYIKLLNKHCLKGNKAGFSILELLIALVIFMIVMAAVFGVLRTGIIMRDNINDRSEIIANARVALNAIGREAINAGFGYSRVGGIVPDDYAKGLLGIPKDSGTERDLFTGIIAGNDISSSQLSNSGEKNDVIAFIYRDLNFNNGEALTITQASTQNNSVVLTTPNDGCVNCNAYDLYLIESSNGSQALGIATLVTGKKTIRLDSDDPLGLNKKTNLDQGERSILTPCGWGESTNCFNYYPQGTAKKIYLVSYSVDSTGTLNRISYGNNTGEDADSQFQIQPLAYNVQNFQVKYLLANGTRTDDPSAGNTEQSKMNDVVQVEIKITIQAEGTGNLVASTQLINLSSSFSTRNLKYDVE